MAIPFHKGSHVNLPGPTFIADPGIILGSFLVFYRSRLLFFDLLTNGPVLAYFFASWLFLFHRPTDGPKSAFHIQRSGPWRLFT